MTKRKTTVDLAPPASWSAWSMAFSPQALPSVGTRMVWYIAIRTRSTRRAELAAAAQKRMNQ
jgi:cytochrome c-type biogenesis protein CcmH/NrfF